MKLIRTSYNDDCTRGVLIVGDDVFYTLELPWKNNERNVSCIPVGTYKAIHLPRSHSGKYHNVYHVQQVAGRSGILIHAGNTTTDTDGCILIGINKGHLYGKPAVLQSKNAMVALNDLLDQSDTVLEVEA